MTPALKVKQVYKLLQNLDELVKNYPNQNKNKLIVELIFNILEQSSTEDFKNLQDIPDLDLHKYLLDNCIFYTECIIETQNL
jgi:hypothetical protein